MFDELGALRWGGHPYLPKASFFPPGSELARAYEHSPAFDRVEPAATERLRAAGLGDLESLIDERLHELDTNAPDVSFWS
jgi:hypothetical protein